MQQELILVDEKDNPIGYGEKMDVHKKGQLHRAFSIFVVNDKNQLMLQRRAIEKYHSGGLWANTCCSHPIRNELLSNSLQRRLMEEMGFVCKVEPLFEFLYRSEFENDLIEHEYDHVFLGHFNDEPNPNPEEVMEWMWMDIEELESDLENNPDKYVYWLQVAFPKFKERLSEI